LYNRPNDQYNHNKHDSHDYDDISPNSKSDIKPDQPFSPSPRSPSRLESERSHLLSTILSNDNEAIERLQPFAPYETDRLSVRSLFPLPQDETDPESNEDVIPRDTKLHPSVQAWIDAANGQIAQPDQADQFIGQFQRVEREERDQLQLYADLRRLGAELGVDESVMNDQLELIRAKDEEQRESTLFPQFDGLPPAPRLISPSDSSRFKQITEEYGLIGDDEDKEYAAKLLGLLENQKKLEDYFIDPQLINSYLPKPLNELTLQDLTDFEKDLESQGLYELALKEDEELDRDYDNVLRFGQNSDKYDQHDDRSPFMRKFNQTNDPKGNTVPKRSKKETKTDSFGSDELKIYDDLIAQVNSFNKQRYKPAPLTNPDGTLNVENARDQVRRSQIYGDPIGVLPKEYLDEDKRAQSDNVDELLIMLERQRREIRDQVRANMKIGSAEYAQMQEMEDLFNERQDKMKATLLGDQVQTVFGHLAQHKEMLKGQKMPKFPLPNEPVPLQPQHLDKKGRKYFED
jgi:hypothetical protein